MDVTLPTSVRLNSQGVVTLGCDEDEDGPRKRKLNIELHTGAPVSRFGTQLIFRLRGIKAPNRQIPILFAHDPERPIGFTTAKPSVVTGVGLFVEGDMLENEDAATVLSAAEQGLQWQASMGVKFDPDAVTVLGEGEKRQVNGYKLKGPALIVEESELLEASVLTMGADANTKTHVFGEAGCPHAVFSLSSSKEADTVADTSDKAPEQAVGADALVELLSAFPGREAWVSQQWQSGVRNLIELKAALADELTNEKDALLAKLAEQDARHEAAVNLGHQGETPPPAQETAPSRNVDFVAQLAEVGMLSSTKLSDLAVKLSDEFNQQPFAVQARFGDSHNYAAWRRAEALGAASIYQGEVS